MSQPSAMKLYGLKLSYFTGKLEAYLRCKGIDFEYVSMDYNLFGELIPEKTGAAQMPALELDDGRWLTDTTPIIQWCEQQYPDQPIIPSDPVQAFMCYLFEDYTDEWLWRAAMHYRWSYEQGRTLLSTQIQEEMCADMSTPKSLIRKMMARRQHTNFVVNDGVSKDTWHHVEAGYLNLLKMLEPIFQSRPFLLGDKPCLADIGLFGPFFRHFGIDPTPAAIMREQAPAVYEWVARMWNTDESKMQGDLLQGIPADWTPLLTEVGETHLVLLNANAEAFNAKQRRFDVTIQGVTYRNLITSRYRVWCLEKLREKFTQLPGTAKQDVQAQLQSCNAWEVLWQTNPLNSGHDINNELPFAASGREVFASEEWDKREKFLEKVANWFM